MRGIGILLLVVLLLMGMIWMALGPRLDQRLIPGTWVWETPVGGLSPTEVAPVVEAALRLDAPRVVILGPDGQRWAFSPRDLGITLDAEATLAQAWALGHSGSGMELLTRRVEVMLEQPVVAPVFAWDRDRTLQQLALVAAAVEQPARNAYVRMEGGALHLEPAAIGRRVELSPTLEALLPLLRQPEPVETPLYVTQLLPEITDAQARQALDIADTILSAPLTLTLADPRAGDPGPWTLTTEMLSQMLAVYTLDNQVWLGLDEVQLAAYLEPLAVGLQRQPVDATFHFNAARGELVVASPSALGRSLNITATVEQINEMVRAGQHFVPLVMEPVAPRYPDTLTGADLGIVELIAVGESYFTGSSSSRNHNVRLGSSKYDGVLVAPGETFSFNDHLGEITPDAGYDESYVIIGNRTVPGVGGGICQVATTVFRAAYYAGYPIVERWPHAYRVGYYEIGGYGPGFDATIYKPLVDFRFTNDTPYHLLIETHVDAHANRLFFYFYSTSDGRTVEQIGPTWGQPEPPGPPIYEYDPTLPPQTVRQLESAHDGLSARLGRVVRDAEGNILYQDTFISNFVPWSARYLYGPDVTPPPGAEVISTPEP